MKSISKILTALVFFFVFFNANAQYASRHIIAPSPWQYWSYANEITISTQAEGIVTAVIKKSDGGAIATVTLTAAMPIVYRFSGPPMLTPKIAIGTVYNNRGLIVEASAQVSISVRNIASDAAGTAADQYGDWIKGNSAMLSYGNEGLGKSFLLGYYRSDYSGIQAGAPVYLPLAIEDNTQLYLNGLPLITLNAGQNYTFQASMGSILTADKNIVVNAGAYIDTPLVCAEGTVMQVLPTQNLGKKYIVVRGSAAAGTNTNHPEQSTIIASEPGTTVLLTHNNVNGSIINTTSHTLANAGDHLTFHHGDAANAYSTTHIVSSKPVIVYSGISNGCEVDTYTVMPYGDCTGAESFTLRKFTDYNNSDLDAYGYIITESPTAPVLINGTDLETLTSTFRTPIGNSGYYMIPFELTDISNPSQYAFTSTAKMSAGIIQRNNSFSMAGMFSYFNKPIATPTNSATGNCDTALLAEAGSAPYQWYLDGVVISGATSRQFTPTVTGYYSVTGTQPCGVTKRSGEIYVRVCSDLKITKVITDVTNGEVSFKLTATNNGPENEAQAAVTDILPTGYTFISFETATGSYNPVTGVWNIGLLAVGAEAVLFITAQVKTTGNHTNIATISGNNTDSNPNNNVSSATPNGNLTLTKKADREAYYNEGEVIQYELVLTNTGNISIHTISIADSNADTGSIHPSQITSLAPGQSITITAQHTITATDVGAGEVINQANAIGESYNGIFVKTKSDNPLTDIPLDKTVSPILLQANLTISKTNHQDIYKTGTTTTYTIVVTNNGPSAAQDVHVTDLMPLGITVMSWSADNQTSGTGELNSTAPELEIGASITYTVLLQIPEDFEGNLANTVNVTSVTPDPDLTSNQATDTDAPCTTCGEITIPKGISPNGDTKNEVFDLSSQPPIAKLEVFNRYGQKVYDGNNYTNQWNGSDKKGNELPAGTYYYVIYFKENNPKTGWVYINRQN